MQTADDEDAAMLLYCPALHAVHTSEVVAVKRFPYLPATQAVHETAPAGSEE